MQVEIGQAAGDIYRFLEANGPATVSELKKATGCKDTLIYQALGWLAREEKVAQEAAGRTVRWHLIESWLA